MKSGKKQQTPGEYIEHEHLDKDNNKIDTAISRAQTTVDESVKGLVNKQPKEKPLFTNICTFTKPVYTAYLRGIESKGKTVIFSFGMVVSILVLAYGVAIGMRLDIIGAGLLGCIVCGLGFGMPWMIARTKVADMESRFGKPQRNITRFYENQMVLLNETARVEAAAQYTDITKVTQTDDFIYMYVGNKCYFAILTGFSRGEQEIDNFKAFIKEKAVNAKIRLS